MNNRKKSSGRSKVGEAAIVAIIMCIVATATLTLTAVAMNLEEIDQNPDIYDVIVTTEEPMMTQPTTTTTEKATTTRSTTIATEETTTTTITSEVSTTESTTEETTTETTLEVKEAYVEEYSDVYLLAYAMSREAADMVDARYVGSVILNRVDDPDFPNTVLDVLQQPGQYDWGVSYYSRDKIYDDEFYLIAEDLLNGGYRPVPQSVVYQAQFVQGSGIYTTYGVHYYCYK